MEQEFYIANHKNDSICKKSSSGGAFTAITDAWFKSNKENAVVYGCVFDEKLNAVHIRACNKSERDRMRGSKYISSDISGVFKSVEGDILAERYVAFSGTPCQIGGLKSFLKHKKIEISDKLLTIEIICHGVGSNNFFKDYIANLEEKYSSKAISCNFRAKSRPYKLQDMEVVFENSKKYNASTTRYDWFYSAYNVKNYILRPACYSCKFAKRERIADITIGDDWQGYITEKKASSVIVVNTQLGKLFAEKSLVDLNFKKVTENSVLQELFCGPAKKPADYEMFWNIYENYGYLAAQKYIGNNTLKGKIKYFLADIINKLNLSGLVKTIKKR